MRKTNPFKLLYERPAQLIVAALTILTVLLPFAPAEADPENAPEPRNPHA